LEDLRGQEIDIANILLDLLIELRQFPLGPFTRRFLTIFSTFLGVQGVILWGTPRWHQDMIGDLLAFVKNQYAMVCTFAHLHRGTPPAGDNVGVHRVRDALIRDSSIVIRQPSAFCNTRECKKVFHRHHPDQVCCETIDGALLGGAVIADIRYNGKPDAQLAVEIIEIGK